MADINTQIENLRTLQESYNEIVNKLGESKLGYTLFDAIEKIYNNDKDAFSSMKQISKYLYAIEYEKLDWEGARKYFEDKVLDINIAGCTGLRKGKYFGRNYDWNYDNSVEFLVRVKAHNGRYASIGIAGNIASFTPDTVKIYNEYYRYLPFRLLDGINENGLACNINMLNYDDKRSLPAEGTIPTVEEREKICSFMLCRYILDNFKTPQEAAEYIRKYVKVYPAIVSGKGFDLHLGLYSKDQTYYIAFEPDENGIFRTIVKDMTSTDFVMTNFRLQWANEDMTTDGHYDRMSQKMHDTNHLCIEYFGEGLERANLCLDFIRDNETSQSVLDFMCNDIKYTNAYNELLTPQWLTEFVGQYSEETLYRYSAENEFDRILEIVRNDYNHRSRETLPGYNPTWQTVHTSVYDLENKAMQLVIQEDDTENVMNINCFNK